MESKIFCCGKMFFCIKETITSSGNQCLFRRPLPLQKTIVSSEVHCLLRRPVPPQETIAS